MPKFIDMILISHQAHFNVAHKPLNPFCQKDAIKEVFPLHATKSYGKCIRAFSVLCFCALLFPITSFSQQNEEGSLKEALQFYQKKEGVKFFYKEEWLKDAKVDGKIGEMPLADFLNRALPKSGLKCISYKEKYIIILKDFRSFDSLSLNQNDVVNEANFKPDGNQYTLSGYIRDGKTGESIIGATIYIEELNNGTATNAYGFFTITLPSKIYNLKIGAVGKVTETRKLFLRNNVTLDFELFESRIQLKEVVITEKTMDHNVSSLDMGLDRLNSKLIKTLPAFLGEADVIKSILLLPGVSTVGEGAGGFNVRGGNVDQNLILLDDAPIFNSSHLFGFFSTFNSDVIKDVTLYKGSIPAQYGGRISSVLDVKLAEGNKKKFSGSGGAGIIASRLSLSGPIVKDKTSFIVGARYAYPNWVMHNVRNLTLKNSDGFYYDLNAKISHKLNDKNNLYLSSYFSEDGFKFAADTVYGWTMASSTLKWNSIINKNVFLDLSGIFSQYNYNVKGVKDPDRYTADFGVNTYGIKADLSYSAGINHRIDFGVSILRYQFKPGELQPSLGSSLNEVSLQNEHSIESGLYIGDELKINKIISVSGGIRLSQYNAIGAGKVFVYDEALPKSPATITDTLIYSNGESIKTYRGFEPRFSLKISIDESSSIKASYCRTMQYIHLISNTTAISPLDLWASSNFHIKPQSGNQVALGYFRNFVSKGLETSIEGYYKEIENMVEYKDGAELFLNPLLETDLLSAFGKAYGVEALVRKNSGKLTGWIGYTYSRTLRKVKGNSDSETINKGKFYPSNVDKPHDINMVANYKFTRRLSLSVNFTYNTGRPITYPESIYIVDGYAVSQYSGRNQGRIPDYHRLDVSFTIDENLRQTQKWKGSWTFAIFNVYGRKNPYSIFFKPENSGKQAQAYRLSVLGVMFPSITYNFKF